MKTFQSANSSHRFKRNNIRRLVIIRDIKNPSGQIVLTVQLWFRKGFFSIWLFTPDPVRCEQLLPDLSDQLLSLRHFQGFSVFRLRNLPQTSYLGTSSCRALFHAYFFSPVYHLCKLLPRQAICIVPLKPLEMCMLRICVRTWMLYSCSLSSSKSQVLSVTNCMTNNLPCSSFLRGIGKAV